MRLRDWFWSRGRVRSLGERLEVAHAEVHELHELLSNYRAARDRVYGDAVEVGLIRVMEDHAGRSWQYPVVGVTEPEVDTHITMHGRQISASMMLYCCEYMDRAAIPMIAKSLANKFAANHFETLLTHRLGAQQ